MAIYALGLVGILVFYVLVLAVGIWAGTKQKNNGEEEVLLAGRNLGLAVGVLTLIATWVGGGYINGTAEMFYTSGLAWCQVPVGYSLSLIVGILFTKPMRDAHYVTMLDPFQDKYGSRIGALLYLPALCGDIFWCGSILNALGSSLVVILELNNTVSIVISAVFAAAYTVAGGFYSVTYTDVLQLLCIALGLSISAPFAYYHDSVSQESLKSIDWLGKIEPMDSGVWIDNMLLLIFGGIPWQGYFQRILSMKSTAVAKGLSLGAFFGCLFMAIPSAFIGIIARGTDWSTVEGYNRNLTSADAGIVLPLSLRYLTPEWVSFFGLGAVSAAVMSSADSSILASSAMFSRNIYKLAIRPKASDRELLWVLRMAVIVVTTLATLTALTVSSVYYLSYLCSDLVYVVLFPQLFLVLFWSKGVNTYGCLACYAVGFTLRLLGGEEGLGIPAGIRYPFYDDVAKVQKFPFRTTAMLCAMFTHIIVSKLARYLFEKRIIDPVRYDVLGAFYNLLHNAKKPMGMGAIARRKGNEDTNEILDFYRVGDPSSVSVISGGAANPTMDVVEKISSEVVAANNASGVLANGVAKDLNKRLASPENTRKEGRETPAADGEFVPANDEISKF